MTPVSFGSPCRLADELSAGLTLLESLTTSCTNSWLNVLVGSGLPCSLLALGPMFGWEVCLGCEHVSAGLALLPQSALSI